MDSNTKSLAERDQESIWHPFTQAKTAAPPLVIEKAQGLYLFDDAGAAIMDAVSSWWVNLHGHCHPFIARRIAEQLEIIEHVIFAGFTHKPAVELAEALKRILPPNQAKIFFSDNGSTSVEVAIKMAIQFWHNSGQTRRKILALEDSYHGDTFGAMAVSSPGMFTAAFRDLFFEVRFLKIPLQAQDWIDFEESLSSDVAALIFEPLIQGSGGMKMYEPEVADRMIQLCKKHNVLSIADEVMTGFGRTGRLFATDYLTAKPDIICLSKGLTGGTMAMGVTSCTAAIYDAFFSNDKTKTFYHGHSYTANSLACTSALASLELLLQENTITSIRLISKMHLLFAEKVNGHRNVKDVRVRGTVVALEWKSEQSSYFHEIRDQLYNYFLLHGILLRPLGNTVYIMPPYCIKACELFYIYEKIREALEKF